MFSIVPCRCSRLTVEPTCSRIAALKIASRASKPLAAITRPAISSVLNSSPAAVLSTPRQRRDSSVGLSTVKDFERGDRKPMANNLAAMQRVIEDAGVRLTFDSAGKPTGFAVENR